MMSLVFSVAPEVLVTQISMRVMLIPEVMVGRVEHAWLYVSLKYCERKKWVFSS